MARRMFREDFDRERNFVALRGFVFAATGYVPGQPIDKPKFTVRRLRQLYDQRQIGYPGEYWDKLGFVPPAGAPALPEHDAPSEPTPAVIPAKVSLPRYRPGANKTPIERRRLSA